MKKILAFDIDGTVLPYGGTEISEEILSALRALADRGVIPVACTGRSYGSVRRLLAPLERELIAICHDGAVSYEKGRSFYRRPIPAEALRSFWSAPENEGRTLVFYTESAAYLRHGYADGAARADVTEPFLPVASVYALKEPVCKMAAYGGMDKAFGGHAGVRRTFRTDVAEEYVCAYTSKGAALSDLQARVGLSYYETYAVGDGVADLSMFRHSVIRCAPPEAPDSVTEAANAVEPVEEWLRSLVKIVQPSP